MLKLTVEERAFAAGFIAGRSSLGYRSQELTNALNMLGLYMAHDIDYETAERVANAELSVGATIAQLMAMEK